MAEKLKSEEVFIQEAAREREGKIRELISDLSKLVEPKVKFHLDVAVQAYIKEKKDGKSDEDFLNLPGRPPEEWFPVIKGFADLDNEAKKEMGVDGY